MMHVRGLMFCFALLQNEFCVVVCIMRGRQHMVRKLTTRMARVRATYVDTGHPHQDNLDLEM